MDGDSDDDFERVSDFEMSDSESEHEDPNHLTPGSTPPTRTSPSQTPRSSNQKTLKCPYEQCYKAFNRQARLKEHLRSHTNTRPYRCSFPGCTKDYFRESHLKHHLKSAHSDVRDYKCTWQGCEKSFATGTRLRRHVQAHEGRERFRCRGYEGCNETFRKHDTLRRHIIMVHEKMRPFPCSEVDPKTKMPCTKAFDTAEKLRAHQRTNHDPTRFSCSDCLARNAEIMADPTSQGDEELFPTYFSTFSELQAHLAEFHPPTCTYCPTSFQTAKELTRHLEIQHGIRDPNRPADAVEFKCTYDGCDKVYTKRGNLNVHVRTFHENRRDFVCGQTELSMPDEISPEMVVFGCGRSFTSKASLEEHVRTAHFGLESKRTQREKKRKAEKDTDGHDTKKRRPRRDKGKKKKSALSSLTGMQADRMVIDEDDQYLDDRSESEADFCLSGSMTMLGSQLYHHTGQWDMLGNGDEFPTTNESAATARLRAVARNAQNIHTMMDCDVDDGFFGGFEIDQTTVLDPELVHY